MLCPLCGNTCNTLFLDQVFALGYICFYCVQYSDLLFHPVTFSLLDVMMDLVTFQGQGCVRCHEIHYWAMLSDLMRCLLLYTDAFLAPLGLL